MASLDFRALLKAERSKIQAEKAKSSTLGNSKLECKAQHDEPFIENDILCNGKNELRLSKFEIEPKFFDHEVCRLNKLPLFYIPSF